MGVSDKAYEANVRLMHTVAMCYALALFVLRLYSSHLNLHRAHTHNSVSRPAVRYAFAVFVLRLHSSK